MNGRYPGSRWWKFDFHSHTPKSTDYRGDKSITVRAWLAAQRQAGLDCVAVTDHNTGAWIDDLKAELAILRDEDPETWSGFALYTGAEFSCSGGVHVLAILDPANGSADIEALRGSVGYQGTPGDSDGVTQDSVEQVVRKIRQSGGIAIPAHVDCVKGLFRQVQDSNTLKALLPHLDAVEVCDTTATCLLPHDAALQQVAHVLGSDSHKPEEVGRGFTWVKMSAPTLDGLRLALLDPESSIRRGDVYPSDPQPMPIHRIERIVLDKLVLHRSQPPLEIAFSPWYTSLIGGRGSGKSTVVEALRLALAREAELQELGGDSEVLKTFQNFRKKFTARNDSGMTLDDTRLAVEVAKDDGGTTERYRYTWRQSGVAVEQWDGNGWEATALNITQAQEKFPVRLFSQKQIYNLAQQPQALLAYLDKAPEVGVADWQALFSQREDAFLRARARVRELEKALLDRAPLETELKEVARKALVFSQAHFADKLRTYQREKQQRVRMQDFTDGLQREVDDLQVNLADEARFSEWELAGWLADRADEAAVLQQATHLRGDLAGQYERLRAGLAAMQSAISTFRQVVAASEWQAQSSAILADYETVVAQMRADGVEGPQQAAAALQRKEAIEKQLVLLKQKDMELALARAVCKRTYVALHHARQRLTRRRQAFVDQVLSRSGIGNLRIKLYAMEGVEGSRDELRKRLRLQDGTFVPEVWGEVDEPGQPTGFLAQVVAGDRPRFPPTPKRVRQLKENLEDNVEQTLSLGLHGKLKNALQKLSPQDWDAVWTWFPDDLVVIEHQVGGTWRNLQQASAGQKSAAILSFLLAHGDEPLILDQPEDDLDNALVYDLVVRQLRDNKARRQLIVVTHNANIVVNGDAELVQPMAVRGGQIVADEADGLQERKVRVRICDIMEGGQNAFKQRYKRILEDLERKP